MSLDAARLEAWIQELRAGIELDNEETQRFVADLRDAPDRVGLFGVLAHDQNAEVRGWAATIAQEVLGAEALPSLLEMSRSDPDEDNRGIARAAVEDLDPEALGFVVDDMLRDLERANNAAGGAIQSMLTLARYRHPAGPPALRAFAARFKPGLYAHEMPLVLADYIENPDAITRRVREHDHEHMFWVAEAAGIFQPPGAVEALRACAESPPDRGCGEDCREALRAHVDRVRSAPQI
jgi:hypothetical protein